MKPLKGITLKPAILSEKYIAKFQIHDRNIVQVYKDDVLVSDSLYRVGGLFSCNEKYFTLLKQVEAQYSKEIMGYALEHEKKHNMKLNRNPNYLASCCCILDAEGKEKLTSKSHTYCYLLGGIIAAVQDIGGSSKIINIETGELISKSARYFSSAEYIFLDNNHDFEDKTRRGIIQLNKETGEYVIHK